jgi:hypothetical protein
METKDHRFPDVFSYGNKQTRVYDFIFKRQAFYLDQKRAYLLVVTTSLLTPFVEHIYTQHTDIQTAGKNFVDFAV